MVNAKIKKWKSIDQQLKILERRGMIVTNRSRAKEMLRRIGYYRLSGYSHPFRKQNKNYPITTKAQKSTKQPPLLNGFVDYTYFSDVIDLYIFDKQLRILCIDAIERIEIAVRVDVSYHLGKLDPIAHMDKKFLDQDEANKKKKRNTKRGNKTRPRGKARTRYDLWKLKYSTSINRTNNPIFVEHNLSGYGELPIWVATEVFDFGALSRLYEMLPIDQRNIIAKKYGLSHGRYLAQWLESLCYIRNICAHHERLWNIKVKTHSSAPKQQDNLHISNIASTDEFRVFRYLCIMQFLLRRICPHSKWGMRLRRFLKTFPAPRNKQFSVESIGVVGGWEGWTLWKPERKGWVGTLIDIRWLRYSLWKLGITR